MRLVCPRLFLNRESRCGTISRLPIKDDIEFLVEWHGEIYAVNGFEAGDDVNILVHGYRINVIVFA